MWLCDAERLSCLAHAAQTDDRREYMQIAQAQAPSDLALPIDPGHRSLPLAPLSDREFLLCQLPCSCNRDEHRGNLIDWRKSCCFA